MDRGLKQRLVGGAVLIALAVIFIPMILDGPPTGRVTMDSPIPAMPQSGFGTPMTPPAPPPQVPEVPRPAPLPEALPPLPVPVPVTPPDQVAPEPAPEPQPVAKPQTPEPPPAPKPAPPKPVAPKPAPVVAEPPPAAPKPAPPAKPATQPAPGAEVTAWAVQVGSFSSDDNARVMRDRLKKAGFPAFTERGRGSNALVRVFVGPEIDRAGADRLAERLQKEQALKGLVVRYP